MSSKLTSLVLKLVADSAQLNSGLASGARAVEDFANKTERTNRRLTRSLVPPDVARQSRIRQSLGEQRERETANEQKAVTDRARIRESLNRQREREESRERQFVTNRARIQQSLNNQRQREEANRAREAIDNGEKRARIAASLQAQKQRELRSQGFLVDGDTRGSPRGLGFAGSLAIGTVTGVIGGLFAGLTGAIIDSATRIVSTGLGVFSNAARKAIEAGISREDSLVSFSALLGSSNRGQRVVDDLTKLAVETPFASAELLDESKLLLSYGVSADELTSTLRRLGDVASGAGIELNRLSLAYGQVIAKGRLQGGEIRQFTEAGIGIRDFADALEDLTGRRVSTTQFLRLAEQGQVSSRVVERAFEKMTSAGGRFFHLMDARSKTFGGRLQALAESFENLFAKIGLSFIQNTSAGRFFDDIAKHIQGIDVGKLSDTFRQLDSTLGRAIGRTVSGLGGVVSANNLPTLDFDRFDTILKSIVEKTIPSLLNALRDFGAAILDAGAFALRFGDALALLIPERYLNPLKDAETKLANERAKNQELRERGVFVDRSNEIILEKMVDRLKTELTPTSGLADILNAQANRLRETNPGNEFRRAARRPSDVLDSIIGPQFARRLKDFGALIANGLDSPEFKNAIAESRRLNALNTGIGRELGVPIAKLSPVDVISGNKIFDQINQSLGAKLRPLGEAFDTITNQILPGFGKTVEDLSKRLEQPREQPLDDFQRNIQAVNLLDSPAARLFGNGLLRNEARRLRGELAEELISRFPSVEQQSAPLILKGTQEAETALTRAIFDSRNNGRTPEEQLEEAILQAKKIQEQNNERLSRLADVLEKPNALPTFVGVGFGAD